MGWIKDLIQSRKDIKLAKYHYFEESVQHGMDPRAAPAGAAKSFFSSIVAGFGLSRLFGGKGKDGEDGSGDKTILIVIAGIVLLLIFTRKKGARR